MSALERRDQIELLESWPLIREFALPPDSTVVEIGAYQGLAMHTIADLYSPREIIGFEPQEWAWGEATKRLSGYPSCTVFPFGIGVKSFTADMGEWHTDGASLVNPHPRPEQGKGHVAVVDAREVFADPTLHHIDLMMINIEGYEYELLPYLHEIGVLPNRVDRLAVQFHLGFGNDGNVDEIMAKLDSEYERAWSEFPAWVYWRETHG